CLDDELFCFGTPFLVTDDDVISFFFFSSRRRHTRSKRDWSSDVCSSDLIATSQPDFFIRFCGLPRRYFKCLWHNRIKFNDIGYRSEERRVGKECRSRWWGGELKKKEKKVLTSNGRGYGQ